jgi:hypothetical protein
MQPRRLLFTILLVLALNVSPSFGRGFFDRFFHSSKKPVAKATPSYTGEMVWSGLVIAENVEKPESPPSELIKLEPTLKELFGYNQFQIIGQSRKELRTGDENWLASSKYFSLHVDARGGDEDVGGYVLNLKLFQQDQMLLEWDTKLSKRSPLVIKGPQVGGGQLLLVLLVQ